LTSPALVFFASGCVVAAFLKNPCAGFRFA
jgi:hypothetical protein